jgi:hypothetical protein
MFLFALLSFALVNAIPLDAVHDELLKTSRWDQEGSLAEVNQQFVDDEGTTEDQIKDPEIMSEETEPTPDYGLDHLGPDVKAEILADVRDEHHMAMDEQPEDEELKGIFNQIKIAYQPTDDESDLDSHVFIGEPVDPQDTTKQSLPVPPEDTTDPDTIEETQ